MTDLSPVPATRDISSSVVYQIRKSDWLKQDRTVPFDQPGLNTSRFNLEPIFEVHTEELWELFRDPELHHFVPFAPQTKENEYKLQ